MREMARVKQYSSAIDARFLICASVAKLYINEEQRPVLSNYYVVKLNHQKQKQYS
ncbi:hypothetical protein SAMN05444277_106112 [Parafilimonas terrae]|uniref:Uncharacterized protein n=1 Tax=Parafilimonas terrae TaxID=1465490 RepID=A0A1I5WDA8_9BACT|nr:hypothetical protein SAMN05444277_106112 [Parafilimonas terrae]